jgi:hypothetical protein
LNKAVAPGIVEFARNVLIGVNGVARVARSASTVSVSRVKRAPQTCIDVEWQQMVTKVHNEKCSVFSKLALLSHHEINYQSPIVIFVLLLFVDKKWRELRGRIE